MLKRVSQLITRVRHHYTDPATSTLLMAERIRAGETNLPWERWFNQLAIDIAQQKGMWKFDGNLYGDNADVANEMVALVYVLNHTPSMFSEHKYRAVLDISGVFHLGLQAQDTFFQLLTSVISERPSLLVEVLNKSINRTAFLTKLMMAVKLPPQKVKSLLPEVYVFFITGWREMKRYQPPQQDMLSRRRHMQTVSRLMHPFSSDLGFDLVVPEPFEYEEELEYGTRVAQFLFPESVQAPTLPTDFTL